jgi:predicted RNase H-like HicB family nuclease
MTKNSKLKIVFSFTAAFRPSEKSGAWVSWCPELDLFSQGETLDRAFDALKETVRSWITHCYKQGILDDSLIKRGWSVSKSEPGESFVVDGLSLQKHKLAEYPHSRSLEIDVPLYMVADAAKRGEIGAPCTS